MENNMDNEMIEEWPAEFNNDEIMMEEVVPSDDDLASMSAGNDAGAKFVEHQVIEKLNLFVEEYRRNGYDEYFVDGFVNGIRQGLDEIRWAEDQTEDEAEEVTLHE